MNEDLLSVKKLKTYYFTSSGAVMAVDDVSFDLRKNEYMGLVGESACGKSTLALSIMRMVPNPPGRIVEGEILFEREDLLKKTDYDMTQIRGAKIAMVYQDPLTYLNPVMKVGDQIKEAIMLHQDITKGEAIEKAVEAMELVEIPNPSEMSKAYPFELSGGMRQRILIAMAISCSPALIIADEPTTALDVIIQGEIIDLLKHLRKRTNNSLLLITHNLAIVGELAEKTAVMYSGNIVEIGDSTTIFKKPAHPYTKGLMDSILRIDKRKDDLVYVKGDVPNPINPPPGCKFHPRCTCQKEICHKQKPLLREIGKNHFVACYSS